MNSVLERETLSVNLANTIERDIISGKLKPDTLLASVRTLSDEFKVSRQVVLSSLEMLEQKDLITRIERKGVFVKARDMQRKNREILFFAFAEQVECHTISRAMQALINKPAQARCYDFFSRIISSGDISDERLDHELNKFKTLGFLDGAVIYPHGLSPEAIRRCITQLPYPVIIVGDLPHGDYNDLQYSQLRPDQNHMAKVIMDYAAANDFTEFVHICRADSTYGDISDLVECLKKRAAGQPFKLRQIAVSGNTPAEIELNFRRELDKIGQNSRGRTLVFKTDVVSDDFNQGRLLPHRQFPNIELLTMDDPCEASILRIQRSFADFDFKLNRALEACLPAANRRYLRESIKYADKVISS